MTKVPAETIYYQKEGEAEKTRTNVKKRKVVIQNIGWFCFVQSEINKRVEMYVKQ